MARFKDHPKGGKQHSHQIPSERLGILTKALRRYCKDVGVTVVGTHGLRHSTSEIYIHHGATLDDLQRLFAHSSASVTNRYVHNNGSNLERVAKVIQLFPNNSDPQMIPEVSCTFSDATR